MQSGVAQRHTTIEGRFPNAKVHRLRKQSRTHKGGNEPANWLAQTAMTIPERFEEAGSEIDLGAKQIGWHARDRRTEAHSSGNSFLDRCLRRPTVGDRVEIHNLLPSFVLHGVTGPASR